MNVIDISIPISNNTPVWEGDKGISITRVESIGKESKFNVSRIEMGVHAGTHIDAPFHVLNGGITVDQIHLDVLVGRTQIIEIPRSISVIDDDCLKGLNFSNGIKRVLFKTRNSTLWETDPFSFRRDYVGINEAGARFLSNLSLKLVGLDYFSISIFSDLIRPHELLLQKGVVVLENINLNGVTPGIYQLFCLPIKIMNTDGAPVRAILIDE